MSNINIGISTACMYPMQTEIAFSKLADKGVKLFEIFFNSPSELEPDFINKLNRKRLESQCKITSIHPFTSGIDPFMLFSDYYRRFEDMAKYYEKFFAVANTLEAKIVVLHGDNTKPDKAIEETEYFERFLKLSNIAKNYGVILAQENVNLFRSESIDFIKRMKNELKDDVSFVFDIKQAIRAKQDPFEFCKAMGKNLIHLHLNDHTENKDCVLPLKGKMDYKYLIDILGNIDYSGDFIVEVYKDAYDNIDELINSCNKFKKFIWENIQNC